MSDVTRFKQLVNHGKKRKAYQPLPRLRLGHTTLSAHLHRLRMSCNPFCPWCRTTLEAMKHFLLQCPCLLSQHTALRSQLSALAITTLNLPTLLATLGVHLSWQPAVLRLTCAFLRKTGQLPRL
ncbi:hypothetical protein E2C01_081267 [Portunus trituberculatus]|uniref:Reverse transcriptase zinc-binding domain-containing protein n=1 Tax=Portunus trituberculatus TaxID=210409 RepID=A0A5B7IW68_PORTR|nr:hypothetical protein [Portunus trituberculatus]